MSTTISKKFRIILSTFAIMTAAMAAVANGKAEQTVRTKSQIAEAEQILANLGYLTEMPNATPEQLAVRNAWLKR